MIVTTLVENTTLSREYKIKHGLSLHIKTDNHNILFDLGPDDTFIQNARKLNIDISDVDIVIISHGHNDHGGGLEAFLKENIKAKIYINKDAFEPHYNFLMKYIKNYIGLDNNFKENNRIVLIDGDYIIDNNLRLFSNIKGKILLPFSNKCLLKKVGESYLEDDFKHEQNLIIKEGRKNILISGCSHCGIVNIIDAIEELMGEKINIFIGGFHLYNPVSKKSESIEFINNLGENLKIKNIDYYTCHCTGLKPFNDLRNILGMRINYLSTGKIIEI